jgi:hypothetical protein
MQYKAILNYCRSCNFQIGKNKIKPLKEYDSITVLFDNAVLTALMSGRKYDVVPQNGDCSRESNVRALVSRNEVLLSKGNVVR